MKIPFYQTTWHGIDLIQLSNEIKHPLRNFPDSQFYNAFYKKLNEKKCISDQWKKKKSYITDWLQKELSTLCISNEKLLSVGAGTGVVEIPLIKNAYQIDLHDYQSESFKSLGAEKVTNCYAGALDALPDQKYKGVFSIATLYAMTDLEVKDFLKSCNRLLQSDGYVIILDTSLSWWELYVWMRNRKIYENNYLRWGEKRSLNSLSNLMPSNFTIIKKDFYDNSMNSVNVKCFRGMPFNKTPVWQLLILKKND